MAYGTSTAQSPNAAHTWLAANLLDVADGVLWTSDGDGDGAAEVADSDYPVAFLNDYRAGPVSKPDLNATTHYLNFEWSSSVKPTCGGIIIHNHNLLGATVTVEVADDAAFSSNLATVHNFGTVSTDARLIAIFASRYTNVEHLRLKIVFSSADTPQIGEVFIWSSLTTYNLRTADGPLKPFDNRAMRSKGPRLESDSGDVVTYERTLGQADFEGLTYRFGRDDEYVKMRALWKAARYGTRAAYLIEDPTADSADLPASTFLLSLPLSFDARNTAGRYVRELAFPCVELGPFAGAGN